MLTIAPVSAQNLSILKTLRLRALQDAPTAFSGTYAIESQFTEADWTRRWIDETGASRGFIATYGDTPCGIAGGVPDRAVLRRIVLVSLWVAPTHRGTGAGRALVESVIDWARAGGAESVQLLVTSNNESARRFYEGLGFVLTGYTEAHAHCADLHEREMIRAISGEFHRAEAVSSSP